MVSWRRHYITTGVIAESNCFYVGRCFAIFYSKILEVSL